MNRKILVLVFFLAGFFPALRGEDAKDYFNPLSHGVPTLTIAPDARASAMGDVGAATEPDVFSQHWNPAKYAFAYSKAGVGVSYTPWLKKIVDDIYLGYVAGYYKLGTEDRHALSASLRYFSIGKIDMTDNSGFVLTEISPFELTADVAYSLKLSETFSMAAALRFIYSDLGIVDDDVYPGVAFAGDVAGYYSNFVMLGNSECMLGLGFNLSNIGSKISYDNGITNNFIPTTLRLGGSLLMPLDNYNSLSVNLDVSKYAIPTPADTREMTPDEQDAVMRDYYAMSPISGIFKSFTDAPGGFKEELQELRYGLGLEYGYDNRFFVRGGYFHEHPNKGNFRYFSLGAGFNMQVLQLDVAYLISAVPSNPLDQTLRFSLSFDMDGLRGLMR
ncbi:MAG: type IX secretion system outer membrane channel protein PorV [Dysgonamonadaceae bacterium]|jgi:hypothetical protein|nr:type IX secretion system outer membrane channel protein PorV [Dysgonamonadaceae bacterium]